jgi:plastocyanin
MRRMLSIIGLVAAFALAACGGGGNAGGGGGGGAACSPGGTTVKVVASGFAYDQSCYAAASGQAFSVDLDNKDSAPHNFAIYTDDSATTALFKSAVITAQAKTFQVKAQQPGTYYFQCDVHPAMNGTFVVK